MYTSVGKLIKVPQTDTIIEQDNCWYDTNTIILLKTHCWATLCSIAFYFHDLSPLFPIESIINYYFLDQGRGWSHMQANNSCQCKKEVFVSTFHSLALWSSIFAIVPRCTSSGPSAILNVLAVAQRCARTVSPDKPAPPCTCIAVSRTFNAIFGEATCQP